MKRQIAEHGYEVVLDARDEMRPGAKHFEWEQKGVPVRIEIGPRDVAGGTCVVKRRDLSSKEKTFWKIDEVGASIPGLLMEIQDALFARAKAFRDAHTLQVESYDQFKELLEKDGVGNFLVAHWDGTPETEKKIKDDTKATIRCIPFPGQIAGTDEPGVCIVTGKPSKQRVIFAKAY